MQRRDFMRSVGAGAVLASAAHPGRLLASGNGTDIYDASVYLAGNYAPVSEEITATDLEIIGELPKELNGRYLRNGANPLGPVDVSRHH